MVINKANSLIRLDWSKEGNKLGYKKVGNKPSYLINYFRLEKERKKERKRERKKKKKERITHFLSQESG